MNSEDNALIKATILVADDTSDTQAMLSLALQNMGYHVVTVADGEAAVEAASVARPNLILMDIAMPRLDGLGAARRIRGQAELQGIPIIALTAYGTEGFKLAAFDAGFDGYLIKPIDFERLEKLIKMLLNPADNLGADLISRAA